MMYTEAFATDEIASAVMVMQGATALDDVADKVLRIGKRLTRPLFCFNMKLTYSSPSLLQSRTTQMLATSSSSRKRSLLG
jgi:transposase